MGTKGNLKMNSGQSFTLEALTVRKMKFLFTSPLYIQTFCQAMRITKVKTKDKMT